ncbi:MotE family protein [Citreimonas sp.]|uniref:MotE family protein n=1 Tax=Citreimonas sp. TaxID=3036715 RepID=UPI0035C7D38F
MAARPQRAAAGPSAQRKAPARKPRRRTRGALATIGGLLIASAILRGLNGAGDAVALELPGLMAQPDEAEAATDATNPEVRVERVAEADIAPLLSALEEREARLKTRETALDMRMQALLVAETEIEEKLAALEAAEARLKETMTLSSTAAETDIVQLTDVYARMKPKDAASLFSEMDPEFAAGFLGRMRPDAAAAILAGLPPRVAYTISVIVAGRNAEAPTE